MIEKGPDSTPNLLNRREAFKTALAVTGILGAVRGTQELAHHIADRTLERPPENPPVPTGYPTFDVYGNHVDSNDLLQKKYATAVRYEERRQEDHDN